MGLRPSRFVVLVAGLVFVVAGCDWSLFGYGPAHTSYNPKESTIGIDNVDTLHEAWTAVLGGPRGGSVAPVTAKGVVYATSDVSPYKLGAFDARGVAGCSGTPKTCTPQWTATGIGVAQSLQVANGLVYVTAAPNKLVAFDAAGVKGCKGTPKTCTALWSASGISFFSASDFPPAITSQYVYAAVGSGISAFDAAGVKGCSGTPKTCKPLWSAVGWSAAVANGVLYLSHYSGTFDVRAYDAAGVNGCKGTPKTCTPLWVGRSSIHGDIMGSITTPTVSNGLVWIGIESGDERSTSGALVGFDATGKEGCAGTPKICSPVWNAPMYGVVYPPAVANGVVYALEYFHSGDPGGAGPGTTLYRLSAFDLLACHTTTKSCSPRWTASLGGTPQGLAVANGVVYVTSGDRQTAAYDAAGNNGCSGSPRACLPLWNTTASGVPTSPVVANGVVYTASPFDSIFHAYALP